MITIFKYNTVDVRAQIEPGDKDRESKGIMRQHTAPLNFSLKNYVEFQIGDYCTINDTRFTLNQPMEFTCKYDGEIDYRLSFEGPQYVLTRVQYLTLNAHNEYTEGKFSLNNTPLGFMNLLINNLKRDYSTMNWQLAGCIDDGYQIIDFDRNNCLEVLSNLAQKYKTEYLIESSKTITAGVTTIVNKIYLMKRQVASGMMLEQGKGKQLTQIGRSNQDNSNPVTRLYVYGSDKNLGNNYRSGAPRLRMAGSLFIEKNVDLFGVYEDTVVFDGSDDKKEIFPHRTGKITSVTSPLEFTDSTMDFNLNSQQLPSGEKPKITFNTGLLSGITFEILSYNNTTKTFSIDYNKSDQTITYPSAGFIPAVGDTYVLIDIIMPITYVNAAEAELKQAGIDYLKNRGPVNISYPTVGNGFWYLKNNQPIILGQTFRIYSLKLNIDRQIRLISYTRSVVNQWDYTFEFADSIAVQSPLVKLFK